MRRGADGRGLRVTVHRRLHHRSSVGKSDGEVAGHVSAGHRLVDSETRDPPRSRRPIPLPPLRPAVTARKDSTNGARRMARAGIALEAATDERVGCSQRGPRRRSAGRLRPWRREASYKATMELQDQKRAAGECDLKGGQSIAWPGSRPARMSSHAGPARDAYGAALLRAPSRPRGSPTPPDAGGPRGWPPRRSTRSGPRAWRGTSGIPRPGSSPDLRSWRKR